MTKAEIDQLLYHGARNTLNLLLAMWTDDVVRNREIAEQLLAQAILKSEGL